MAQVPHRDAQWVRAAYESFVGSAGSQEPPGIDPVVAASWRRSLRNGVDPDRPSAVAVATSDDLEDYRRNHPLAVAMPLVRDLVGGATGDDLVVAVSDDVGRLLWVEGRGPWISTGPGSFRHGRVFVCSTVHLLYEEEPWPRPSTRRTRSRSTPTRNVS